MDNKNSKIYVLISVFVFVFLIGGISYSYFVYEKDLVEANITTGNIQINFTSESNSLSLTNQLPISDVIGKNNADYLEFTITGSTDYESIKYEIEIVPNSSNTLEDQYVKVYLTDQNDVEVSSPLLISSLPSAKANNGKVVYSTIIEANSDGSINNYSQEYRLRVWIDENYSNIDNRQYGFSVYLYAENFGNSLAKKILSQCGNVDYIKSYNDTVINDNPTFTTQDQVSTSATKKDVCYYTGDDAAANANVLFAGYCWQIIRTTDNGGVRMIYNGVAVNDKCETTRTATKGINGQDGTTENMSAATLFGRSYDYDLERGVFTLQDSTGLPTSWTTNDNNSNGTEDYKELIGTYTCLSSSATCSTLYYVESINQSNTGEAYVAKYTIGDVAHFSQLGTSAFNSNRYSPALVGYMFNKEYDYKSGSKEGEYFATAVWNGTTYTLSNGNSGTAPDAEHHYICDDNDCTKVRYYYYVSGSTRYYILLENGKTVEDALKEMINYKTNASEIDENINVYNSAMKGYLDNWYKKNLTDYTSFLDESSVYCNDRSISNLGGWNPSAGSLTGYLQFKQYSVNGDLNCVNETDRFSVTNNKAKLTYPIGLLTEPEKNLMTSNFAKTGQIYWVASPYVFTGSFAIGRIVDTSGGNYSGSVKYSYGARGVVSLRPGTKLEDGSGTYTDPYVVGPLVTRTN